jgi:hypothetical protein
MCTPTMDDTGLTNFNSARQNTKSQNLDLLDPKNCGLGPTNSSLFVAFFIRSHAHERLRHQVACIRILLASHYLLTPLNAFLSFSFVRQSDR